MFLFGCLQRAVPVLPSPTPLAFTPWPMEGGNGRRTRATTERIQPPLIIKEQIVVGGDTQFVSPVAVVADWLVVDGDRRLHVFQRANLQEIWRVGLPGSYLSPTIGEETLYVRVESGEDGFLVAFELATGDERWRYHFPVVGSSFNNVGGHVTSPLVVGSQVLVGAAQTLNAFAVDTGELLWQFDTAEPIASSVAVSGSVAYIADFTHLYAIDPYGGRELWRFTHDEVTLFFAPIVTEDAVIIADRYTIYALAHADGHVLWQRDFTQEVIPAAADTDHVYVKTVNQLWALDHATGDIIWDYESLNFVSLPAVTADQLYVITRSAGGSQLRALRSVDGVEVWKADDHDFGNSAPVASQGTIYVRTNSGEIVGYRSERVQ